LAFDIQRMMGLTQRMLLSGIGFTSPRARATAPGSGSLSV